MSTNVNAVPESPKSPVRAVLYFRAAKDPDGRSIARQEEACRRFAREHGLEPFAEFTDLGRSVGLDYRPPGFQRMLESLVEDAIAAVVVYDDSRLSRNLIGFQRFRDAVCERGARLYTVTGPNPDKGHDDLVAEMRESIVRYLSRHSVEGTER
ncbi:recombinase family protein [Glycomyces paridis]|uniref:Recombinase family protein n=1 Tax=Glycomyces paridis TaxID=2126555 RepID=A0A4S8PHD7_9ACTN|nr:recombinase family protein [Glycomyces paridis]THV27704.1 recombinase family protein [Glycomyces paridis]